MVCGGSCCCKVSCARDVSKPSEFVSLHFHARAQTLQGPLQPGLREGKHLNPDTEQHFAQPISTPAHNNMAAAAAALHTAEIVEQILLYLSAPRVLVAARVSHFWHATVQGSIQIQAVSHANPGSPAHSPFDDYAASSQHTHTHPQTRAMWYNQAS